MSQALMLESWIRVAWHIMPWASDEVGSSGISAVSVVGRRWSAHSRPEKYLSRITGMWWSEVLP